MTDSGQNAGQHAKGQPSAQDQGTAIGTEDLAGRLSRPARTLQQEDDPDELLAAMVHAAVQIIPGTEEASITVVTRRYQVTSRAASGSLPARVDALQNETGEGPCLDTAFEEQTVRVADMAHEPRWPAFAPRACGLGAASMLASMLYVQGDNLGALNLYAGTPGAFTDESEHISLMVASHAAVAFAEARKAGQLSDARQTRDLTGHQAFVMLSRLSQDSNMKLHDVADRLVVSGELEATSRHQGADRAEVS